MIQRARAGSVSTSALFCGSQSDAELASGSSLSRENSLRKSSSGSVDIRCATHVDGPQRNVFRPSASEFAAASLSKKSRARLAHILPGSQPTEGAAGTELGSEWTTSSMDPMSPWTW